MISRKKSHILEGCVITKIEFIENRQPPGETIIKPKGSNKLYLKLIVGNNQRYFACPFHHFKASFIHILRAIQ